MYKKLKKTSRNIYIYVYIHTHTQIENINKEQKLQRGQVAILEPKNSIPEIKNSLKNFNSRFEQAEGKKKSANLKIGQSKLSNMSCRRIKE